jgi:hypothetical protein
MPSRFERYRVKDGVTVLGERYFNPVWQDVDVRLAALEDIRISWEQAVKAVSDFGLLRINEVIGPALESVSSDVSEISAARLSALDALAVLQASIANLQDSTSEDIQAWKAERIAELVAWQQSIAAALPSISARLDAMDVSISEKVDSAIVTPAIADLQANAIDARKFKTVYANTLESI